MAQFDDVCINFKSLELSSNFRTLSAGDFRLSYQNYLYITSVFMPVIKYRCHVVLESFVRFSVRFWDVLNYPDTNIPYNLPEEILNHFLWTSSYDPIKIGPF